jgi:hypothetical protein
MPSRLRRPLAALATVCLFGCLVCACWLAPLGLFGYANLGHVWPFASLYFKPRLAGTPRAPPTRSLLQLLVTAEHSVVCLADFPCISHACVCVVLQWRTLGTVNGIPEPELAWQADCCQQ